MEDQITDTEMTSGRRSRCVAHTENIEFGTLAVAEMQFSTDAIYSEKNNSREARIVGIETKRFACFLPCVDGARPITVSYKVGTRPT